MKNQWIKFKHWLIKKLCGHVSLPVAPKIEYHYETPITLHVKTNVPSLPVDRDSAVYEEMIRRELAIQIAKALLDKNLIEIVKTEDPVMYSTIFEARVRILRK